ncbi:MAG: hypothetical protein LBQ14_06435 [Treponema sp.]|jgi:hypothetical protein|nr:hypothetical protein [Treponema sp.]
MRALLENLAETAERCALAGTMGTDDLLSPPEYPDRLYSEIYRDHTEFREADKMLREKFSCKRQEIENL